MIALCLDTSSVTSVALVRDREVIARAHNDSVRHHAESIVPLLRQVLSEAGISGPLADVGISQICVGTGPAPYTGLRAGLVTARTIARAIGVPVRGASSLDILARQALDVLAPHLPVMAVSDARRRELYWGLYRAQGPDDVAALSGPSVGTPRQVANAVGDSRALVVCSGPLPTHAREALGQAPSGPAITLDPAVLVRLVSARLERGQTERLGTQPLYLRRPDIQGQPAQAI